MYDIMHRTQLNLDDWQYESLKSKAEREGRSLSDIVREAVTEYLEDETDSGTDRLRRLEGLASDAKASGRHHDRILYGG